MLNSIYTSCTWLPLKTFCCPPSLHSSLAENREQLLGQEKTYYLCALHMKKAETGTGSHGVPGSV